MRVLQVITLCELGGAQTVVANIANGICDNHDVIVASGEGDGKMWHMLDDKVQRVHCKHLKRRISFLNDLLTMYDFWKIYRKYRPDVIHLHSSKAGMLGRLVFPSKKIIYTVHGFDTIRLAKEKGYSEPDPRIDLSGTDVIRKLVILAREAGYKVEQADVKKNLFVPNKYFEGSLEDFWKNISELDAEFEAKRQQLAAENKKYRFVATMKEGICEVGLQAVDSSHPFYDLEGSNNIVTIQTERYFNDPMIIKGYGAGASVTAAGVFGDIMSIANIR